MKAYSGYQYALFRIVFGVYLTVHFAQLVPHAASIWSNEGMLADASLSFTFGKFPNVLFLLDSSGWVTGFVVLLMLASLCFTLGIYRPLLAVVLWYGWACLFHRNHLIANPSLPIVGWLLLANALIPAGEPWALRKTKIGEPDWRMPKALFWGAWLIVGISYTISGIDKAMAPSWCNGTALSHLLVNPLARDWFWTDWLASAPDSLLKIMTWLALGLEMGFGFLCLFNKTRLIAWLLIMSMHLGILSVVAFADLTLGVMLIHLFTLDPHWFAKGKKTGERKVVYFDGVCGMCNAMVNFLMAIDTKGVLLFSPLQGSAAQDDVPKDKRENMDTVVYWDRGDVYLKSTAILKIFKELGGVWFVFSFLLIIPSVLRDSVYGFIAKNRYRWFGEKEACRMPTPEERSRFLD